LFDVDEDVYILVVTKNSNYAIFIPSLYPTDDQLIGQCTNQNTSYLLQPHGDAAKCSHPGVGNGASQQIDNTGNEWFKG